MNKPTQNKSSATQRTDPDLWEACKFEAIDKMGGKFSARAMQFAVKLYKERGGGYVGQKDPCNALAQWTREQWDYVGEPGHSRYLPKKAREALSRGEKAATSRAKNAGTAEGRQWVPQPESIAKKVRKYRTHITSKKEGA